MSAFDEDELREFVDYVKDFMCDSTRIIYINDFDLTKLDMKDFGKNIYFISNPYIERGKVYEIIDKDLKLQILAFCTENHDKVFQGEKQVWKKNY
jgi:hypothetical protein